MDPIATDTTRAAARTRRPRAEDLSSAHAVYVAKVPQGDVVATLRAQLDDLLAVARALPAAHQTFRYAPGKWSITELFGHITDMERAFGLRAMCFARKDPGPLPSVDEDPYVAAARFDARGLASVAEELEHLRRANLALYSSFDDEVFERRGTAASREVSVRTLVYLTAGHTAHHLGVLRERYLAKLPR